MAGPAAAGARTRRCTRCSTITPTPMASMGRPAADNDRERPRAVTMRGALALAALGAWLGCGDTSAANGDAASGDVGDVGAVGADADAADAADAGDVDAGGAGDADAGDTGDTGGA